MGCGERNEQCGWVGQADGIRSASGVMLLLLQSNIMMDITLSRAL
jgi:hypothetical protein